MRELLSVVQTSCPRFVSRSIVETTAVFSMSSSKQSVMTTQGMPVNGKTLVNQDCTRIRRSPKKT